MSRVRDFFVIARQSAFVFKGRFIDVREVGEELGVAYVVEGTVQRGGSRLRISVQLVDAQSRNQLWSDRYEGDTSELFAFRTGLRRRLPARSIQRSAWPKSRQPGARRRRISVPTIWSCGPFPNCGARILIHERSRGDPATGDRPRPQFRPGACIAGMVPCVVSTISLDE